MKHDWIVSYDSEEMFREPFLTTLFHLERLCSVKVLYASEIWSLTLRDEHKVKGFGNKVLNKIIAGKREVI
jgi:hypothetical protein